MVKLPTILELLKSGAHFGHQSSRWHPKMAPYIFGIRNGVHVIDLEKTIQKLSEAQDFIQKVVSSGGTILFLGTKKQVQDVIKKQAQKCNMPYMTERWVGGFLTNFSIVIKLTDRYKALIAKKDSGEFAKYTKKEQLNFQREINKLEGIALGIKDMKKLPDAIFVWDVKKEQTAILEAQLKKIPIVGICDTNTNPQGVKYVIPVNDDATKSIELITNFIADCIIDAQKNIKKPTLKEEVKSNKK